MCCRGHLSYVSHIILLTFIYLWKLTEEAYSFSAMQTLITLAQYLTYILYQNPSSLSFDRLKSWNNKKIKNKKIKPLCTNLECLIIAAMHWNGCDLSDVKTLTLHLKMSFSWSALELQRLAINQLVIRQKIITDSFWSFFKQKCQTFEGTASQMWRFATFLCFINCKLNILGLCTVSWTKMHPWKLQAFFVLFYVPNND